MKRKGMSRMGKNFVITISHQLGCGGSELGKKLSERLSVPFVDRQILKMVADHLRIPEEDLEYREERRTSFWESFLRLEAFADPVIAMEGEPGYPNDRELFELEKRFILEIARKGSAVFLGRGARAVLREVTPHLGVFVTASREDRVRRVSALYSIPEREAARRIERNDRERDQYMRAFPRFAWLDPRSYDLCVNTSSVGVDTAAEIVCRCLGRPAAASK